MNICIYSPYLYPAHFGGGEKYLFDVALTLAKKHQVSIAIPAQNSVLKPKLAQKIRKDYEDFLNVSLKKLNFIATPIGTTSFFLNKILWTKQFDVLYYATDGSLFFSLASKNILHIQVPYTGTKESWIERWKLANWQVKNANSVFTKNVVEKAWKTSIPFVHYPMVTTSQLHNSTLQKEKIILHVGRFFKQLHCKKQETLVSIFRLLVDKYPEVMNGWKLVLIGSVEDKLYARSVEKLAKGYPIELHHQVNRAELIQWYQLASIYWHATGYGVDQERNPEKVEHFGISTVEAMAAGCAPVVINKGGQPEVVGSELQALTWTTKEECMNKTLSLINDPTLLSSIQAQAQERAELFSPKQFQDTLDKMLSNKAKWQELDL